MEATFYKRDNYAAVKGAFNSAWPNLHLELHHPGPWLDHEGRDEFDDDAEFAPSTSEGDVVLWLTDKTISGTALKLLSERFAGQAFILRDYVSVEEEETLEYCNDPFKLPLNEFNYGEFKRRFSERWSNLSIELYDRSPDPGGLGQSAAQFPDDFDMGSLGNAGDPLHDYIFISDWGISLKRGCVGAAIRNNKLGTYCEGNCRYKRLKAFQSAD